MLPRIPYLTNTQNSVILQIPSGKEYFFSPAPVTQQKQKGGTCWKYSFNVLRSQCRIGHIEDLCDASSEFKADTPSSAAIALLLEERRIEKIISNHRKAMTKRDMRYDVSELKEEDEAKKERDEAHWQNSISTCQNTLTELGYKDLESQVLEWYCAALEITMCTKVITADAKTYLDSDLKTRSSVYSQFTNYKIAEKYGLKYSKWTPSSGFDDLLNALRTEGLLNASGEIGKAYYINPPKFSATLADYDVYYWPPGAAKKQDVHNAHSIIICGAEQVQTTNNQTQKTILFMDPNDGSEPGKQRPVYRMSYHNFINNFTSYEGVKIRNYIKGRTHVFCAAPEKAAKLQDACEEVFHSYETSVSTALQRYKQTHANLSNVAKARVAELEAKLEKAKDKKKPSRFELIAQVNKITSGESYRLSHQVQKTGLDTLLQSELSKRHFLFAKPKTLYEKSQEQAEVIMNKCVVM